MLLAYVDESYTDNWFTMAALLVGGPPSAALQEELDRIAEAAAAAYGLSPGVELHGHEISTPRGRGATCRLALGLVCLMTSSKRWPRRMSG
jgi:hypothetical protein